VPARKIGSVAGPDDGFDIRLPAASISAPLDAMAKAYFDSIADLMDSPSTGA
jgi:hypothetical protein